MANFSHKIMFFFFKHNNLIIWTKMLKVKRKLKKHFIQIFIDYFEQINSVCAGWWTILKLVSCSWNHEIRFSWRIEFCWLIWHPLILKWCTILFLKMVDMVYRFEDRFAHRLEQRGRSPVQALGMVGEKA